MKVKKLLLYLTLIVGLMAIPLRGLADEGGPQRYKSVTITTTDGKQYGVNLIGEMQGKFNYDADLELSYPKRNDDGSYVYDPETNLQIWEKVLIIPGYQVSGLEMNKEISGADIVSSLEFSLSYDVNTSLLTIEGAERNGISIFTSDGRMEYSGKGKQTSVIDMSRFGSGVHIVKIGNKSFKLLVK